MAFNIPRPLNNARLDWVLDSSMSMCKLSEDSLDAIRLPSLSIVIPSFNSGEYIESAIRSVLLQEYPNLELIVVDACSEDQTGEVLEHYKDFIDKVIREPDNGQSDAIRKGLLAARGDFFNWVNADDMLAPGALRSLFQPYKEGTDIISGFVQNVNANGSARSVFGNFGFSSSALLYTIGSFARYPSFSFHQPGVWIKTDLIKKIGINTKYNYIFDLDLFIRVLAFGASVLHTKHIVSCFRYHENSKTCSSAIEFHREVRVMRSDMLADETLRSIHGEILKCEDSLNWQSLINSYSEYKQIPLETLLSIAVNMLKKPSTRLSRSSLSCMIRGFIASLRAS